MCSDREADPVAFAFAKAGYHAFVLRYSVMDDCTWPNPLNDYEQAMTLIRPMQIHGTSTKIKLQSSDFLPVDIWQPLPQHLHRTAQMLLF